MAVRQHTRIRRPFARLVVGAAATLLVSAVPVGAQAAPRPAPSTPGYCTSASNPQLADRLSKDIASTLSGRQDTVAFAISDTRTGVSCAYHSTTHFDSASVVKATIMGAVLRRAEDEKRYLTTWEDDNLQQMITASDNTAATNLWKSLGMPRLQAFLKLAGMNDTQLGADGYWGLTQITADDELKMLDVYTGNPSVITPAAKAYGLGLMSQVEADQRWGTPFGAPAAVSVHVKNGWLPRATHGWRVHSLGIFTGAGKDYRMAVLTQDNATESYGIDTIQGIASAVHRDLNSAVGGGTSKAAPHARGAETPEASDGSAPFGPVAH
ncbi:serine hydrolase [Saccharothrix sp. ST-888]|uniref:serine hydrolase n=1 Tax=Saccharothrix sp. ST-888 TaxID=1427391 RepID=UPI000AEF3F5E|nr:serine hydrolase [Saccharothrix sp. ST-888]